jgi:OmcA/MtrC family decaheme c-type cytochrome
LECNGFFVGIRGNAATTQREIFKEGTVRKSWILLAMLTLFVPLLFLGCGTGSTGPAGAAGQNLTASVVPESCSVCHSDVGETTHQAVYDDYVDTSLSGSITGVVSTPSGTGGYDVTMTFTLAQSGLAYVDAAGLPTFDQKSFRAVDYDSTTLQFVNTFSFSTSSATPTGTAGEYTVTADNVSFAPESSNAEVYLYIAKGELDTERVGDGGHVKLYSDVLNLGKAYGTTSTYVSAANVSACESCHGKPYRKHGYRMAVVSGLPDFAACKNCHSDQTSGGDFVWQLLVDDPARAAEVELNGSAYTSTERTFYAYKRSLMNDVHMSHSMEFEYPQSMRNCATCHASKLSTILTDANFVLTTCRSCHAITGSTQAEKPQKSLIQIWTDLGPSYLQIHGNSDPTAIMALTCNGCHYSGNTVGAKTFSQIHTGYDPKIYTDVGARYADSFQVTIDNASVSNYQLTFGFHATESPDIAGLAVTDIVPHVMVGLYGYDTKDFLFGPHERSIDSDRDLEFDTTAIHPRLTTVSAGGGAWTVTADLSHWAAYIDNSTVKQVEIAVLPKLLSASIASGATLALNAPSRTFSLVDNAFKSNYYQGTAKLVNVTSKTLSDDTTSGCNVCHDALGTTFHSANYGGNIVVCRMCHTVNHGGSNLEMVSRSIDAWAHALHSFEAPFHMDRIDFTDPVNEMFYRLKIESNFPRFTIKNCEACHEDGKFNVPDGSKSLPGVISASYSNATLAANGFDRNIGDIPSYIVGPASKACGGCHRVHEIKADDGLGDAGGLAAFNQHTKAGGYLVEYQDNDQFLYEVDTIMAFF